MPQAFITTNPARTPSITRCRCAWCTASRMVFPSRAHLHLFEIARQRQLHRRHRWHRRAAGRQLRGRARPLVIRHAPPASFSVHLRIALRRAQPLGESRLERKGIFGNLAPAEQHHLAYRHAVHRLFGRQRREQFRHRRRTSRSARIIIANPNLGICGGSSSGFFNTSAFATPPAGDMATSIAVPIEGPASSIGIYRSRSRCALAPSSGTIQCQLGNSEPDQYARVSAAWAPRLARHTLAASPARARCAPWTS